MINLLLLVQLENTWGRLPDNFFDHLFFFFSLIIATFSCLHI